MCCVYPLLLNVCSSGKHQLRKEQRGRNKVQEQRPCPSMYSSWEMQQQSRSKDWTLTSSIAQAVNSDTWRTAHPPASVRLLFLQLPEMNFKHVLWSDHHGRQLINKKGRERFGTLKTNRTESFHFLPTQTFFSSTCFLSQSHQISWTTQSCSNMTSVATAQDFGSSESHPATSTDFQTPVLVILFKLHFPAEQPTPATECHCFSS